VRPWRKCTPPPDTASSSSSPASSPGGGSRAGEGTCGILLSLSGVGAKANDQADAHKYRGAGQKGDEFTFGFERCWVLAPEREGAHNWEGTGYQTAMRSMHALANMTRHHSALKAYAADVARLLYTGHSRGGHGAFMTGHGAFMTGIP